MKTRRHRDDDDELSDVILVKKRRLQTGRATKPTRSPEQDEPKSGKKNASNPSLALDGVLPPGRVPYNCPAPGCEASYVRFTNLQLHINAQHHDSAELLEQFKFNGKPFECPAPGCSAGYVRKGDLKVRPSMLSR